MLAIVVGMIIGSGIFLKPSIVLADAGTPLASLAAWIAGGIITFASALTIAEIASAIPRTGGHYTYLEELYGEPIGYLLGWVRTIVSYPASIAAQAIAFATYANIFFPMSDWGQKFMAFGILGFLLVMNIISTKFGGVLITAGIMISVFGVLNGYLMTAARVPQAMGEKGQLPFAKVLGALRPKFQTPANALIMQSIIAVLYILSGLFNTLTDMLIFVLWIFFTLGVIGICGSMYIIISTIISSPVNSFVEIGLTVIGYPAYLYTKKMLIN